MELSEGQRNDKRYYSFLLTAGIIMKAKKETLSEVIGRIFEDALAPKKMVITEYIPGIGGYGSITFKMVKERKNK